ncbi:hypothetical protein, partial [Streptomyces sp. adm13(2018)]|uniref:hypothetical protein n=1 Tax=Streptomyces sp. adm13(2018) TaxID=2479007 RepID=UPI001C9BBFBC
MPAAHTRSRTHIRTPACSRTRTPPRTRVLDRAMERLDDRDLSHRGWFRHARNPDSCSEQPPPRHGTPLSFGTG